MAKPKTSSTNASPTANSTANSPDEHSPSSPSASITSSARKATTTSTKPASTPTTTTTTAKPRLTAHQKNTNHKDAENKRRNAIREQFTELAILVPGAEGLERSEYVMLQKTIAHFREEADMRRRLVAEAAAKGVVVDEGLVLGEEQYGGGRWRTGNVDEFERGKRRRIEKEGSGGGGGEGGDDGGLDER